MREGSSRYIVPGPETEGQARNQLETLLRSEIPSGMCAKLRTVAASNNSDHARNLSSRTLVLMFNRSHVSIGRATTSQSLLLLLARTTCIMVLFFSTSHLW